MLGAPVQRAEDPALITGRATFGEDLTPAGTLHLAVLRSPYPHARIDGIDIAAARDAPGVWLVLTGPDVAHLSMAPDPDPRRNILRRYALVQGVALMPGDPVAAVVAETPAQARDAVDQIEANYEPLDVVGDVEDAINAPPMHQGQQSNVAFERTRGDMASIAALDGPVVVEGMIDHPRVVPAPMEGRVAMAEWRDGRLTMHMNTQAPSLMQDELAKHFDVPAAAVRVVTGFVGGAFGAKFDLAEEEMLVAHAAHVLARPVKWIETRREHLQSIGHGRSMRARYRLVAEANGRIKGLSVDWLMDLGCRSRYLTWDTITARIGTGAYDIPLYAWRMRGVWTNRSPRGIYRGAGRPEATLTLERAIERLADQLGMDSTEVRRINFIGSDRFPYKSVAGYTYDTGDYERNLDHLLETVDYVGLRQWQQQARNDGRLIGIGVASYVEVCGFEDWGAARVTANGDGSVSVQVETLDQGQGHRTAFAQITAARLGLPIDQIRLEQGDTALGLYGHGTAGSRSVAQGGSAVDAAAGLVADKAKRIAAFMLEAAPDDVELSDQQARVRGTDISVGWREIVDAAHGGKVPGGDTPGLEQEIRLKSGGWNFPFGSHLAVVEVDRETGVVTLLRMVAVDDAGIIVNPMLAAGQRHGGMAQGIGQALWEAARYDEFGNLVTSTFVDYLVPTASSLPSFELAETVTPTPTNPLGAKGIGEAGAIGSTPAVVNAVCDALGRQDLQIPLNPEQLWRAIKDA